MPTLSPAAYNTIVNFLTPLLESPIDRRRIIDEVFVERRVRPYPLSVQEAYNAINWEGDGRTFTMNLVDQLLTYELIHHIFFHPLFVLVIHTRNLVDIDEEYREHLRNITRYYLVYGYRVDKNGNEID